MANHHPINLLFQTETLPKIARDWNAPRGSGHVPRFQVLSKFLARYEVHEVGGREHAEYWIPAEDLPAFNDSIVGEIEVTGTFPP